MKIKNLLKRLWFFGAVVLIITAAFSPTIAAQFFKANETTKVSEFDEGRTHETTTCNDALNFFNDELSTTTESGLLNLSEVDCLNQHIKKLLNMKFLDAKNLIYKQITNKDIYKEIIKQLEASGVTDEMSFIEVIQLISSSDLTTSKLGEDVDCGGPIYSYGLGYAYSYPSFEFPGIPWIKISGPIVLFGFWDYTTDESSTAVYCLDDITLYDIKGSQIGWLTFLFGFFIRIWASPLTQGDVVILGVALKIRITQISEELSFAEDLKIGNNYRRKEYIENTCNCNPIHDNQIKTDTDVNYLKAYEQDEKPSAYSYQTFYDPHEPIRINGNDDFKKSVEECGVICGIGTIDDPYVIGNWEINAESGTGIHIKNTDAYFIIDNCYVHNGDINDKSGILFSQVKYGCVRNCIVSGNDNGIVLFNSTANKVTDCTLFKNEGNIYLNKAKNNKISGCILKDSSFSILSVFDSSNNHIINCDFQNNLFGMGLVLSSSHNYVSECNISKNHCGILSVFSWDNKINYNNIYNNDGAGQLSIGMLTFGSIEDATNNWWGSMDGPGGNGPGNGDAISWIRGDIAFDPWLTEPI